MAAALKAALGCDQVDELGRVTGQSKRLRVITPARLVFALVGAMACGTVESIADLLRAFNCQNGTTTAYKAFYNRLAHPAFPEFMRQLLCRLLGELAMQILEPEADSVLYGFEDIVIQDGSSFALKDALREVFPGRFTTLEPAAVELHATYSGFEDNAISISLAPDSEAERQFLPQPEALRNKLLLADRGYGSVPYFTALDEHEASFIIRLTRSYDPWVLVAYTMGKPHTLRRPARLRHFLSQHPGLLDLDVAFLRGGGAKRRFRLLVLPGKEKWSTRLCTNLDRNRFSLDIVAKLYRFRWQVELYFKEWKSYANLHSFDTANPYIAEGLIWAGLCAAVLKRFFAHAAQRLGDGTPISTRRVAMCVKHVIGPLLDSLARAPRRVVAALRELCRYLLANAQRANPHRDRKKGRQNTGLALVGCAAK